MPAIRLNVVITATNGYRFAIPDTYPTTENYGTYTITKHSVVIRVLHQIKAAPPYHRNGQ